MKQDNTAKYQFILGILLGVLLHIAFGLIWAGISWVLMLTVDFFRTSYNFFYLLLPLLGIAISQMIYLLPAYIVAANRGKLEMAKGIAICAIVTALLSSGCFALIGGWTGLLQTLGVVIVLAAVSAAIAHWFTRSR